MEILKENQWLLMASDLWIEIFISLYDLKELSKLKRVCKFFQQLVSANSFFKKWNSIFLNDDIPPFETNSDLFKRTYYRINIENGAIPKKFLIDFNDSTDVNINKYIYPDVNQILHEWEPFYMISKSIKEEENQERKITFRMFREEKLIKEFSYQSFNRAIPICSDIPGYLIFMIDLRNEKKKRIIAIPTRNNLKILYYDIFCMGNKPKLKYKHEIFSISIFDQRNGMDTRDFYQIHFKDFCIEGEEKIFPILHTKTPNSLSVDDIQTSERSILLRDTSWNYFYFSFDKTFTINNDILKVYKYNVLLVSDKEEDFILLKAKIIRCKTKETKNINTVGFGYHSYGFINKEGNILAFDSHDCYCIDTGRWDSEENKLEIKILWTIPFCWDISLSNNIPTSRLYVIKMEYMDLDHDERIVKIIKKNDILLPSDLFGKEHIVVESTIFSSLYLTLEFEAKQADQMSEIKKRSNVYYLDYSKTKQCRGRIHSRNSF